jgi:hypothetical protein
VLSNRLFALNDQGVAVGDFVNWDTGFDYAASFDASGAHFLSPDLSIAFGINDAGVIVGNVLVDPTSFYNSGYYRDASGMHLLQDSRFIETGAVAIDNTGRIFGGGRFAAGGSAVTFWENTGGGYAMYFLNPILDAHTSIPNWRIGWRAVSDNGEFIAANACYGPDPDDPTCGSFVFQSTAPEPSTIVLLGSGLLFVVGAVRRRSLSAWTSSRDL